jgi:alkylation response protein AidB-like acyl-CoA dehydrogenase
MLRDTARRVAEHLASGSVAELEAFDTGMAWKSLHSPGFVGLRLPVGVGGGEGTTFDLAIVVEALANRVVPLPFLGTALATELLLTAGASSEVLERIATGDLRCTIGLTPDLRAVASTEDGPVVAFDAADADAVLILEPGEDRLRTITPGPARRATDLTRMVCHAEASDRLDIGSLGDAIPPPAMARFQARALALTSADLVGLMTAAVDAAVTHARNRVQFGVPIGSFQAVQQLAADQLVTLEGCRSLTEYAAWATDHLDVDQALVAAHSANAYCSRAGRTVCEAVIQIHGGMGITWDSMAHVYLKRALVDAMLFGDYNVQISELTAVRNRRAA